MFATVKNIARNQFKPSLILRDAKSLLGFNHSYFTKARGARIIVYHGICDHDHLRFNTIFLTSKIFEAHLKFYKQYFNVISLDQYYNKEFSDDKFNICLTFDDGFENNYKHVLPLLDNYEMPATFFITSIREVGYDILWNDCLAIAYKFGPREIILRETKYVKDRNGKYRSPVTGKFLADELRLTDFELKSELIEMLGNLKAKVDGDYWLQMTEEQIKNLASSKWVTIGSHGYYHNDLAKIPLTSAKNELMESKKFLENISGKAIKALAFPYGSYTKEVISEANKAGYSQLLAAEFLFPDDKNKLSMRERLIINPFISTVNQMHANITGKY